VEVKGYRKIEYGARAALQNLLAYRETYRDFFEHHNACHSSHGERADGYRVSLRDTNPDG
jgi:hypothetical protein